MAWCGPQGLPVAEPLAPFMGHHQYGVLAREVNEETTETPDHKLPGRTMVSTRMIDLNFLDEF
jgi:hypothetical protein